MVIIYFNIFCKIAKNIFTDKKYLKSLKASLILNCIGFILYKIRSIYFITCQMLHILHTFGRL